MSILNVYPGTDCAIVAVDTAAGSMPGAHFAADVQPRGIGVARLHVLANVGAVLAGRGEIDFIFAAYMFLALRVDHNFDELSDQLPTLCAAARLEVRANRHRERLPAVDDVGMLTLVGYSERAGRVQAHVAFAEGADAPFEKLALAMNWTTPSAEDWDAAEEQADRASVQALMQRQVRHFKSAECPALGGGMVYAKVTRSGVVVDRATLLE